MTKPRAPLTLDAALKRIADALPGSWDEMAEIAGRQPWLVRAWGDSDRREEIPVRDGLRLDQACHAAGGGTPIAEYYLHRLDRAGVLAAAPLAALAAHAIDVVRECGEAGAALFEAAVTGGDGAKARAARREVEQAIAALHRALPMLVGRDAYDRIFSRPGPAADSRTDTRTDTPRSHEHQAQAP